MARKPHPKYGPILGASTGTKGSNSITLRYGNGRSDTFFGSKPGTGVIGKGHGHIVKSKGTTVYNRPAKPWWK